MDTYEIIKIVLLVLAALLCIKFVGKALKLAISIGLAVLVVYILFL